MAKWSTKAQQGESGFADRYLLTVRTAKFGFPWPNATDRCALVLDGERNIDGNLDDGNLWLAIGDFEPGDEAGSFALHSSQDVTKHFNQRSKIGRFLKSAREVGLMDVLQSRQAADREQYEEKDASIWVGLTLDIEEVSVNYGKNKETGEEMEGRQPFVRGFSEGNAPVSGAAGSQATASGSGTASANGAVTEDQAKLLAKGSATYLAYLETITSQGVDAGDAKAQQAFYDESRK